MSTAQPATIRHWLSCLFILSVASLIAAHCVSNLEAAEATLQGLRENVRRPNRRQPPESSAKDDFTDDKDDDDWNPIGDLLGKLFGGAIVVGGTAPFWGPKVLVGDDYARSGYFPRDPYAGDLQGYMMIEPWVPMEPSVWTVRARAEYGENFNDLSHIGGHLLFETTSRFGFDTELTHRREEFALATHDSLWTGDANILLRFAQSDRVQMRTGLGVNWLTDEWDTNAGFNFTYGGDFYPRRPWIISAEMDVGTLGSAVLFHGRATAGLELGGVEVYTGYDYYDVGQTRIGGMVGGVRIWY